MNGAVAGNTAFLVQPECPQEVANALRRALTDDELVDTAAQINGATLKERLDDRKVQEVIIAAYKKNYKKEPLI